MAEELLAEHGEHIATLTIVPSSGGRFVVMAGTTQVFNKKKTGRFPDKGEAAQLLARTL